MTVRYFRCWKKHAILLHPLFHNISLRLRPPPSLVSLTLSHSVFSLSVPYQIQPPRPILPKAKFRRTSNGQLDSSWWQKITWSRMAWKKIMRAVWCKYLASVLGCFRARAHNEIVLRISKTLTWLTPSNSGTALSTSLHLLLKLRFSPLESTVWRTLSSALNCNFTLRCVSCT